MFMGLVTAAIRHAQPDLPDDQISKRWLAPGATQTGNVKV